MYLELAENTTLEKGFLKKLFSGVKKIGLAAPRNAYLGMVALNVRGWATAFQKAIAADEAKVRKKWEQLGGNFDKLRDAVNSGAKKKHLFDGSNEVVLDEGEQKVYTLSAAPLAAAIAAAAPIIAALAPLLKSLVKDPDLQKGIDETLAIATQMEPEGAIDPTKSPDKFNTEKDKDGAGFLKSIPTPVLWIGGGVLAFLVLRPLLRPKK